MDIAGKLVILTDNGRQYPCTLPNIQIFGRLVEDIAGYSDELMFIGIISGGITDYSDIFTIGGRHYRIHRRISADIFGGHSLIPYLN